MSNRYILETNKLVEDVVALDWRRKKVKNPATGNTVQVGSLPPAEQEKYRPKTKESPQPDVAASSKKHLDDFMQKTTKDLGIPDWELVNNHLVNKKTGEKIKAKGAYNTLHKQLIDLAQASKK